MGLGAPLYKACSGWLNKQAVPVSVALKNLAHPGGGGQSWRGQGQAHAWGRARGLQTVAVFQNGL